MLTCPMAKAGVAEITCDTPGGWTFEASVAQDNGRDVVTVRIRRMPSSVRARRTGPRTVIFVNATGAEGVFADLTQQPSSVGLFDVFGASRGKVNVAEGLVRLSIPTSGYAVVTWQGIR